MRFWIAGSIALSLAGALAGCGDKKGGDDSGTTDGGTTDGGTTDGGTTDAPVWAVDGQDQSATYDCTTTLPGGVWGVTTTGGDWTLELSTNESHSDTWTLPQDAEPQLQVRVTRLSDGAVYDRNPTGSLTMEYPVDMKLMWDVTAHLEYSSGGTGDPTAVDVTGTFYCNP